MGLIKTKLTYKEFMIIFTLGGISGVLSFILFLLLVGLIP